MPGLLLEAPRLRADLEHGDAGRVVDVERRVREHVDRARELRPVVVRELPRAQPALVDARDRAHQALGELELRHLEREQGDRLAQLHRDVLGDVQREARLAHRRPGREDDQVRALQPGGDAVEIAEPRRDARDAARALARRELGDAHERVGEQLADRREVLAVAVAREVVDDLLRLVDEVLDLARPVVAELRDLAARPDQPAQRRVRAHDLGVAPAFATTGGDSARPKTFALPPTSSSVPRMCS